MLKWIIKISHAAGWTLGYLKGVRRSLKESYLAFKYGGKDKIPVTEKEQDIADLAKGFLEADDFQFSVALGMLHKMFNIPVEKSYTFGKVKLYYVGGLDTNEEYLNLTRLMCNKKPRREVFNMMVKLNDVPEHKLNYFFPVGEKRQKLEDWLDHKTETVNQ